MRPPLDWYVAPSSTLLDKKVVGRLGGDTLCPPLNFEVPDKVVERFPAVLLAIVLPRVVENEFLSWLSG